jgi:catechol 2,3-dioxygenase-like lactoylglutathione lyase family enzyme
LIKQISHVCFGCRNLSKSINFYRALFDFDVVHEYRNDDLELYGVFLSCGNNTFLELFNDKNNFLEPGLFKHLCFEVDNLVTLLDKFTIHKIPFEQKRGKTDATLQAFILDPDGNKIEFHQYDQSSSLWVHLDKKASAD